MYNVLWPILNSISLILCNNALIIQFSHGNWMTSLKIDQSFFYLKLIHQSPKKVYEMKFSFSRLLKRQLSSLVCSSIHGLEIFSEKALQPPKSSMSKCQPLTFKTSCFNVKHQRLEHNPCEERREDFLGMNVQIQWCTIEIGKIEFIDFVIALKCFYCK